MLKGGDRLLHCNQMLNTLISVIYKSSLTELQPVANFWTNHRRGLSLFLSILFSLLVCMFIFTILGIKVTQFNVKKSARLILEKLARLCQGGWSGDCLQCSQREERPSNTDGHQCSLQSTSAVPPADMQILSTDQQPYINCYSNILYSIFARSLLRLTGRQTSCMKRK